jgi:hypothetical protein
MIGTFYYVQLYTGGVLLLCYQNHRHYLIIIIIIIIIVTSHLCLFVYFSPLMCFSSSSFL